MVNTDAASHGELTPKAIVQELDKYIVGQHKAKRAVAIALRNRYRRSLLDKELRDEVAPKNILMIGPTGVGKTEIARRLAKLARAPFIKVEATKFTEVGYVGRDVDSIVRDLVETAVRLVKMERMKEVEARAAALAEERLVALLAPGSRRDQAPPHPFGALFGAAPSRPDEAATVSDEEVADKRREIRRALQEGRLEDAVVEVEVDDAAPPFFELLSGTGAEEMGLNLQDMLGSFVPKRRRKRRVAVSEARRLLTNEEAQKLIDMDEVTSVAVDRAEQDGIVFIDELDKVAGRHGGHGPDVSREGVQRDILPIVEGSTVMTKYGPVKTDHMLFIAAGAFHVAKPSDLIPELQGRFPIRVELDSLSRDDFRRILTEPQNALLKQYVALLATEGVDLEFTPDGIDEIARLAEDVNDATENIGARRLHTIAERLLEDLSFEAPDRTGERVVVDRVYVRRRLADIATDEDLSRYIL